MNDEALDPVSGQQIFTGPAAGKIFGGIFVLLLCILPCISAQSLPKGAEEAIRVFFQAVNSRNYQKAYEFFSAHIRQEISLSTFQNRAEDIRSVEISRLEPYDVAGNLIKVKIKAKVQMRYQGEFFRALYAGRANLVMDGKSWKVDYVELSPMAQKKLPHELPRKGIIFQAQH